MGFKSGAKRVLCWIFRGKLRFCGRKQVTDCDALVSEYENDLPDLTQQYKQRCTFPEKKDIERCKEINAHINQVNSDYYNKVYNQYGECNESSPMKPPRTQYVQSGGIVERKKPKNAGEGD